ncbi:trypsin-like serine peptidase [Microbispora bryophytorum]|uniref:trypsin-like serine peptidase n=1 Tax=Microbispora bryophytorum TaxID=1460882 RepID=UPI0033CA4064
MTPSLPLLAVAALVTGLLGAPGREVSPVGDVVEHVAGHASGTYWTPQRMARAVPIGLLGGLQKITTSGPGAPSVLPPAAPSGSVLPPVARTALPPVAHAALLPAAGAVLAPGQAARRSTGTAGTSTTKTSRTARTRQAAAMPPATTSGTRWAAGGSVTRTTGRVFLTLNEVDFSCSASAVHGANRDLVVTAGHCVKDGAGDWAENWTFVPGYDEGRQPYGAFPARRMFVAGPWSRSGNDDYDVGMVAVDDRDGRHLTDLVGGQPIAFDPPRSRRTYGFGFPADPPYDGERLLYCAGVPHGDPQGQTRDQGLRCNLTAGASGGPWLSGFDPVSGRGTLTSVSSFKYSNDHRTMYGPYFGSAVRDLYRTAERA